MIDKETACGYKALNTVMAIRELAKKILLRRIKKKMCFFKTYCFIY